MAEAIMSFKMINPHIRYKPSLQTTRLDSNPFSKSLRQFSGSKFVNGLHLHSIGEDSNKSRLKALPHLTLMAVLVEHMEGQRDLITHKSIWHLSDQSIKNVYTFYIMFTVWGCCFFGSTKDPYYDSEHYRKDGGDGTGHWVYEKQEDIEEKARSELWREELIEEIEKKVGGLRELEEAKEEELVK
ncbi:photosynthetic NDH subunit of subcomplex B 4, chloroplastic [Lactuca sativa]|uniref:photosynthetic NDH subunit of subcomplex B 4, chloroplastic n=1 Tax=Lactuca sativa TaxID=4236 RepID=UPI000CD973A4|nr:photosynthetic NDH subunit of subcomplex B 4, chloroplastic [Lactuca sativa]